MRRVAGYVRVSRVAGREGDSFHSPKAQAEAVRAHAKVRGLRLVEVVEELDASGGTMGRPKLQHLIGEIRAGRIEGIVVARLDRFARTLVGGIQALEEIHAAGGFVQTVDGGIDTSSAGGAMGDLQMNMLLTLAQWERAVRAEGFEAAKVRAVERGVHISGTVPIGYLRGDDGVLELNELHAAAVTDAFALRAGGASLAAVGRLLQDRIPGGPSGKGSWARNSVARMLANRAYLGEARQGKHSKAGAHPALVDEDTFQMASAMRTVDGRTASERATKSLLAGLVRCGSCGHALDRNRVGGSYLVYRCRGHSAAGKCAEPTSVMVATLDNLVTEWALSRLDAFRAEAVHLAGASDDLRARLAVAASKRAAFEDPDYVAVLGVQAATRALRRVDGEVDELETQLAGIVRSADVADLPDSVSAREHWPSLTVLERRMILTAMMQGVLVYRGKTRRSPAADRVRVVWRGEIFPVEPPARGHRARVDDAVVDAGVAAA